MDDDLYALPDIYDTRGDFQTAFAQMVSVRNLFDARLAEGIQPQCNRGCNKCCRQAVAAHTLEGLMIAQALRSHSRYKADPQYPHLDGMWILTEQLKRLLFWKKWPKAPDGYCKYPCFFLVDGECSIYNVRPAACRLYASFSPPERCERANTKRLMRSSPELMERLNAEYDRIAKEIGLPAEVVPLEMAVIRGLYLIRSK